MIAKVLAALRLSAKDWTDIVVAIMSIAAFIVSVGSFRISSRALRLLEQQEERKQPRLAPRLLESHFETLVNGDRIYAFLLSVGNPTDSDNAIARIEMHLRYKIDNDISMTVNLPPTCGSGTPFHGHTRLVTPCRIAAHDTLSGWCNFTVEANILSGRTIECYWIALTDSHQSETSIDILIVNEKRHAI